MSNEVQEVKSFSDRMKDRIRDSIGELMPDEELAKLVERGVEEIFFERRVTGDSFNQHEHPSLIHEIVKELLQEKVEKLVSSWIFSHPEELKKVLDKTIQEGAGGAVISAFTSIFQMDMANMKQNIETRFIQG